MIKTKTPRETAIELLSESPLSSLFNEELRKGGYEISMDCELLPEEEKPVINYLNHVFKANQIQFKLRPVYSGFFSDIVVTDLKRKRAHDALLTEHTIDEAYEVSGFNKGIVCISENPREDRRLTQKEFDELVADLRKFKDIRIEKLIAK